MTRVPLFAPAARILWLPAMALVRLRSAPDRATSATNAPAALPGAHLFIFVVPKPGMSETEFFRYWKDVHAVRYGQKIPQVMRYLIDCRLPVEQSADPPWSGAAEVWLEDDAAVLDFISSKEYVEGARVDEPNFLAFWQTVSLTTAEYVLLEGPPQTSGPRWVKIVTAVKRKAGMSVADFRRYSLEVHAELEIKLPGLRRYVQCHVVDSAYVVGESILDAVSVLWFDNVAAASEALSSPDHNACLRDLPQFLDLKYVHRLICKEHWVVGPEPRGAEAVHVE